MLCLLKLFHAGCQCLFIQYDLETPRLFFLVALLQFAWAENGVCDMRVIHHMSHHGWENA